MKTDMHTFEGLMDIIEDKIEGFRSGQKVLIKSLVLQAYRLGKRDSIYSQNTGSGK